MPDPEAALGAALAKSIQGGPRNPDAGRFMPAEPLRLRTGKVTAADPVSDTCSVTTDGVNVRTRVPALAPYVPVANDVVWVLEQPPHLLVLGKTSTW
jgi:hypothetical protein